MSREEIDIKFATDENFSDCRRFDHFNKDVVLKDKIKKQFVLLAWQEYQCVGYLRWDWFWNRMPYLCLIKVQKNYQNRGIGKQLLLHWEQELVNQGFKFSLSSSQENEPDAVNWHKKNGYKEIGRLATLNEDGSTEIFLRKELA